MGSALREWEKVAMLLVFIYDLRLRARTYAVAVEVSRSSPDQTPDPNGMLPKRLDEDLAFSMVLMLVNSTLVFIGLEYWLDPTDSSGIFPLIISAGFFAVQISFYCWYWPRLARGLVGMARWFCAVECIHGPIAGKQSNR